MGPCSSQALGIDIQGGNGRVWNSGIEKPYRAVSRAQWIILVGVHKAKRNENCGFLVHEVSEWNKDSVKIWARNPLGYIFDSVYLHSVVVLRRCIKFEFKGNKANAFGGEGFKAGQQSGMSPLSALSHMHS